MLNTIIVIFLCLRIVAYQINGAYSQDSILSIASQFTNASELR